MARQEALHVAVGGLRFCQTVNQHVGWQLTKHIGHDTVNVLAMCHAGRIILATWILRQLRLLQYDTAEGRPLAVELGPFGIRVNAICPVIGETALLAQFMRVPDTPENRAKFIATIPLGRLSQPKDVAQAAAFLASDEAAFISGVEFPVDGARTV